MKKLFLGIIIVISILLVGCEDKENVSLNEYTITFESYGGSEIESIMTDEGKSFIEPLIPIKEGYSFLGWFSDLSLNSAYDFNSPVIQDLKLHAKYSINSYILKYIDFDGSILFEETVEYLGDLTNDTLNDPVREGYTFEGWYSDESLTTQYTFSSMPAEDVTQYAKWDIIIYDITYLSPIDGAKVNNPYTYTMETATIILEEPILDGYTFSGWFDNAVYTGNAITEVVLGSINDITLHAKWKINQYTCAYVSLGLLHSSAITSEGQFFIWGNNSYGQLGDGSTTSKTTHIDITSQFILNEDEKITNVSLGFHHSSAITSEGRIFTWGDNSYGQLGDGTTTQRNTPTEITSQFILNEGEMITNVSLGFHHSSAITSEGRIFTWGDNDFGKLGNGLTEQKNTPTEITSQFVLNDGEIIADVSLGYTHSSAITSEGRIFAWGYNGFGQLGDGTSANRYKPTEITSQFILNEGETITNVSIAYQHSSAITSEGRIFTWGDNSFGQLGDGTTTQRNTPTEITSQFILNEEEIITNISLGHSFSSATTSEGRIFTWGDNSYGQLGDGTTNISKKNTPIEITSQFILNEGEIIINVSLGFVHASAITSEKRIFIWGSNHNGQLGDGTTTDRYIPTEVVSIK